MEALDVEEQQEEAEGDEGRHSGGEKESVTAPAVDHLQEGRTQGFVMEV